MKRILLSLAVSAAIGLGACASGPGYRAAPNATAAGYSEQLIDSSHWRVRYTGTTRMTSAQVQDYALMRAAQLTLENGGQWFQVVSSDSDADLRTRTSIETDFGPEYAVRRSCGLLGCTTEAVPVMWRAQVERSETRKVYEHVLEIMIGHGEKVAGSPRTYDASQTFHNLNAKLG
jgi:hypothetical protein